MSTTFLILLIDNYKENGILTNLFTVIFIIFPFLLFIFGVTTLFHKKTQKIKINTENILNDITNEAPRSKLRGISSLFFKGAFK